MDSKSKNVLVAEVGRLHAIVAGVERALSGRPATLESEAARQVAALVVERDELRATVTRISGGMVPLNGAARACSPDIETEIRHLRAELAAVQAAFDMEGAPEYGAQGHPLTMPERVSALLGRWQEAIYKTICSMVPDPDRIDGAGSDAGALELTLAEVSQGLAQVIDQRDGFEAERDEAIKAANAAGAAMLKAEKERDELRLTLAAEQG